VRVNYIGGSFKVTEQAADALKKELRRSNKLQSDLFIFKCISIAAFIFGILIGRFLV
jgi:hypothetical protein